MKIRSGFLLLMLFLACALTGWSQRLGSVTVTADPNAICVGESTLLHAEATMDLIIDFETGDFSQFSFNNDQSRPWTVVSADNGSSYCMKSGNSGVSNSSSTISAVVEFATMGMVTFDAKCMGEGTYTFWDRCIFSIDGNQQFVHGADVSGWNNYFYYLSAGTHIISWAYSKDSSVDLTGDAFFVDNICFNDNVEYSDLSISFETGNFSQANFNNSTTGSNKPWIITNSTSASGNYCMMSGNKGMASTSSVITLTHVFESAGYITFDAKCMGETGGYGDIYDKCRFYIDGNKQFEIGANGNTWNNYTYNISSGSHIFKWEYTKDSSVDPEGDAFYVDNISLVAVNPNSGGSSISDVIFIWTPGNMIGPNITVSPTQTTTYTVMAYQDDNYVGSASKTVTVYTDPNLSIITNTEESSICVGDSITIHVMVSELEAILAGDILCTDGSIEKASQFASSGKTAMGVVFFVDATGQHGWAVCLSEVQTNKKWSTEYLAVPGLLTYSHWMDAVADIDGYSNTQRIRNFGNETKYPAAFAVDFDNGWYLPAIGQLSVLFGSIYAVNNSLEALESVGGNPISYSSGSEIWSSTASSNNQYSMMINPNVERITFDNKTATHKVRPVINF